MKHHTSLNCLIFLLLPLGLFASAFEFSEQASWIHLDAQDHSHSAPAPYLRKEFQLSSPVKSAHLTVTAKGLHKVSINGEKVTDALFLPGWTDYAKRIYYHEFDVTDLIIAGGNAIGVVIGEGWYSGFFGTAGQRQNYGVYPELLLELNLQFEDGSQATIVSDDSWKSTEGAIRSADIYNGEHYDARLEMNGWDQCGFDDSKWESVATQEMKMEGSPILEPAMHPPVKKIQELHRVDMWQIDTGRWIFDLGQNMVGWARIKVPSVQNQQVIIRFAEMLQEDQTLYTENYRSAESTDSYTCKGGSEYEAWEPSFTFHGFRYVELSGLPEDAIPESNWVTGVVLHSDIRKTGYFRCSNPDLNQLQSNIVWGQKGNFLEIPTDCPQRDERLGWTGDAQVFAPTACFNFEVSSFFRKWMTDLRDAQNDKGAFPYVAPNLLGEKAYDSPAWGDAGIVVPWEIYLRYGDIQILEENYEAMWAWINYQKTVSHELIRTENGFGDWLQPHSNPDHGATGDTSRSLIGTAYFAYGSGLLAHISEILGKQEESEQLNSLHSQICEAFQREFLLENGTLKSDTQTAYLLALGFDLLPKAAESTALENLLRLIDDADGHLRTGFVGTPLLNRVLSEFGHTEIAYSILLKESYPGWLFSIQQGATTMWERWNSYSHEDGFGNAGMNSFNHYAYGAIGQWMYETIAGLKPDPEAPGYRHFWIAPEPGGELQWAEARLETKHGQIGSRWQLNEDRLTLTATVAPGTRATVLFPKEFQAKVYYQNENTVLSSASLNIGEGVHQFICEKNQKPSPK